MIDQAILQAIEEGGSFILRKENTKFVAVAVIQEPVQRDRRPNHPITCVAGTPEAATEALAKVLELRYGRE